MPNHLATGWRHEKPKGHVFIALPTYGNPYPTNVQALMQAQASMHADKINADFHILTGDCHVDDTRNNLARLFLESEASHMMWIDADVGFPSKAIQTLLGFNEHAIGATYPYRDDSGDFPVTYHDSANVQPDERGLIDVKGLPGGFFMLSKEAVVKLYEHAQKRGAWQDKGNLGVLPMTEIWYRSMSPCERDDDGNIVRLGRRVSGDYEVCETLQELGYKIWCAPHINLTHTGTKTWAGNLGDLIGLRSGVYLKKCQELVKAVEEYGGQLDLTEEAARLLVKLYNNAQFSLDHVTIMVLYGIVSRMVIEKRKKSKAPVLVIETGSGVSTAAMALAGAKVHSLEESYVWGGKTEEYLRALGGKVSDRAWLHIAKTHAPGWYDDAKAVGELNKLPVDLVVIDGPVRRVAGQRAKVCDNLPHALNRAAMVVVDDVDDMDGQKLMQRLAEEFGFVFDIHNGPRRQFAVGRREEGDNVDAEAAAEG